jgi:DNA-binding NtrC family response regulator
MTSKKLDVLFVDFDQHIVDDVKKICNDLKVSSVTTTDLVDGLAVMDMMRPRVVITGLRTPDFCGENVAIRFSELIMFKESFVYLLLTQQVETDEMFSLLTLGFNDVFFKTEYVKKIKDIINEKCKKNKATEAA